MYKPSPHKNTEKCLLFITMLIILRMKNLLGVVAHISNPSPLGGQCSQITRSGVQDQTGQHNETPSLLKNIKISWAWWLVPVITATWELEVGELLELGAGRRRLQWAEVATLHSSLGYRVRSHLKKRKKKKTVQLLQKTAWQHLNQLNTALPCDPAVPLLNAGTAPLTMGLPTNSPPHAENPVSQKCI